LFFFSTILCYSSSSFENVQSLSQHEGQHSIAILLTAKKKKTAEQLIRKSTTDDTT